MHYILELVLRTCTNQGQNWAFDLYFGSVKTYTTNIRYYLLTLLSPYGLLPRPPIMIYLKMIQEKAPIHELVIFVSRQWWDKRNFPPQIKVNNGVPTTFISCTYLDDAAGIKLGNIKERSCKSPTNLASKIHYKRQNGSAGILTSKNKAIINEYNRVWLIFRRKCFADVI